VQIWNDWLHDIWIDAQLPPRLANWLVETFNVEAYTLRDLNLRDAEDEQIFQAARQAGIVIISKDSDFVEMVLRLGSPPQLLWVTCGNVTNRRLENLLLKVFPRAQELLSQGEAIVELTDLDSKQSEQTDG
jgi:predicted nuclease of predicted toxin-antitoxin system